MESRSPLLHESSLVALVSLIEECSRSLEVTWLRERIEDPVVKPPDSSVRVSSSEYVIYQDFGSGG